MPARAGSLSESVPPGPKYQVSAAVPAMGHDEKKRWNAGYGSPAVRLPVGEVPAPLSNSTRISGSASNADSANWYVGCSWIGSGGSVTMSLLGSPIAAW